jgi:RHS repeat-associated protein
MDANTAGRWPNLRNTRTFNNANEYTGSVTNGNKQGNAGSTPNPLESSPSYNAAYDAVGNLVDDQANYTYKYDAFGRLTEVRSRTTTALIAEYRSNGLGFRTGWHYDATKDSTVNASDPWYWFCNDTRWRPIATFRDTDADPKERVIFHAAGLAGVGQSSYIDSVILRDLDIAGWTAAASETLDQRRYILQNWRADVVATTQLNGDPSEYVRYSPYGVAMTYPVADINRDGSTNSTDSTDWNSGTPQNSAVIGNDLNKDGSFTTADTTLFTSEYNATTKRGGYTKLGTGDAGPSLRIGYAGYQWDPSIKMNHVRHRVYDPGVGRWTRRDPLAAIKTDGLYAYGSSDPLSSSDPSGLIPVPLCYKRLGIRMLRFEILEASMRGTCPLSSKEFEQDLRRHLENDTRTQQLACSGAAEDVQSVCRDLSCPPDRQPCVYSPYPVTVQFVSPPSHHRVCACAGSRIVAGPTQTVPRV